jgi:hypothetical protein
VTIEEPSVIFGGSASDKDATDVKDGVWRLWIIAIVEVASEYAVDPIVMAGPPGKRVWELMMYTLEGFGVMVVESRVSTGAVMAVGDGPMGSLFGASAGGMVWLAC